MHLVFFLHCMTMMFYHKVVELVVSIPTIPRSSKSDSGAKDVVFFVRVVLRFLGYDTQNMFRVSYQGF